MAQPRTPRPTPRTPREPPPSSMVAALPDLLAAAGLDFLSAADLHSLALLCLESLTQRVGDRLSEGLDPHQIAEFEALLTADNDRRAQAWLERTVPHYRVVVAEETQALVDATARMVRVRLQPPAPQH